MSAPLIDVGDLIEFIDELRLAGCDISTQQYIGAQNLLLALAANGHLPSDPRALQTWLAPVLCSSPREQNNFYRRFDRWITQNPRLAEAKAAKKQLDEEPACEDAESRDWRSTLIKAKYLVPLLALLGIIAGFIFLPPLIPRTFTGQVVDNDSRQPLTNARISFGDKTTVSDSTGGFSLSYRSKQLPATLIAEYPEYETATLTVDANTKSPLLIELQQPVPSPDPSPTPDPPPSPSPSLSATVTPNPTPIPTPSIEPETATWNRLKWVRYGGAIFPLFLFGVWLLWEKKLSNALLKKMRSATQPHLDQIVVKGAAGQLFLGQSFRRTIQELRRHRQRGARELDATGTVHRTIEKGGLFSPFYGLRQTLPEYLVLIDRASFQDQQARLEEELIRRLVQENVFVDSYYFQGDPRTCRTPGKDTRFVTLQEMAALHPDHHLIIFSDGSTFLNPVTGAPESWLEMFLPWAKRALLTPEPAAQWGYHEWVFAELDFIVLPATKEGLAALTELIDGGTSTLLDRSQRARPFPPMLRERPRRWLDNHEPPPDIANQLCDQLKLFLGSKGYFWLSACSIYPILYWDLTLYLGFKLFSDRAEIEDRLLSLVRLPWFRYGTLPDWLRTRLSSELTQEDNLRIRRTLEELFLTVLQKPSEGIRLDIASGKGESRLKRWLTSWKFKRLLRQALKEVPPESPLRDYVFLAFMSGRKPRKLTVSVPDSIRRVFFPQGQFALGMRPLSALVLAALLSFTMFSLVPTQAGPPGPGGGPTPSPSPSALRLYAEMSDEDKNGFVRQTAPEISAKLGPGSDNISDEGLLRIKNEVDNYAKRIGSNSTSQEDEDLRTVLTRGSQYAPTINQAFSERKVPPIVGLYIAMAYTGFTDQSAETRAGASGIFQLTAASAQDFGITEAERSDITKSAQAAARYVASSMNTLGSDSARMPLVILSYKRGVTKVAQDVRRLSGSQSFWNLVANATQLDQQFQNEDIRYVPRFFAAAIIGENPQNFGIELAPLSAYKAIGPTPTITPTPTPSPAPAGLPRLTVTVSPTRARVNQPVTFTLRVTPEGGAVFYSINFGDGPSRSVAGSRVTHTYSRAGTYQVSVVATLTNSDLPIARRATVVVTSDVTVPNLVGMSYDVAQKMVSGSSLSIGKVTYQETSLPDGRVIAQTPQAGALVASGTRINIVVAGEAARSVEQALLIVPNVVGMKVKDAMKRLSSLGLSPVVADDKSDDAVYAPVAGQSPQPGTRVAKATKVILYLKPVRTRRAFVLSRELNVVAGSRMRWAIEPSNELSRTQTQPPN